MYFILTSCPTMKSPYNFTLNLKIQRVHVKLGIHTGYILYMNMIKTVKAACNIHSYETA